MEIDEPTEAAKNSAIVTQLQAPLPPVVGSINPLQKVASPVVSETKVPSPSLVTTTAATATNCLGITPNKPTTTSLPQSNSSSTTNSSMSSTPAVPATNNHIPTPTPQLKTNSSSPSLANALTSLPDISAALRRLSSHTVPASVIEQLSSSPRLTNIGHISSNNNSERRSSMIDVSPSEILGNALAAVAANAAAAASQQQSRSSPKQPQPSTTSTTTSNQQQQQATAIGNLAQITANISNLLHSGGFHRNSFSQEDTQKLAAAVAVARNQQQQQTGSQQTQQQQTQQQQQRRKSSMAAFSNMIDQAMLMNRKSIDKCSHLHHPHQYLQQPPQQQLPPPQQPKRPKLIIKNDQVWKSSEGKEEKHLGYQLYAPNFKLPNLENGVNGVMEVRVPARYLTFDNVCVRKRALWGTDIYTDDSDIVASKFSRPRLSGKSFMHTNSHFL